ncbi:xylulokinase [Yoonia sp.]|uniref:xylulokinase n=1 Tax=Yoonia sp. TaxID=2212373 RepID=UPI002FD9BA89
MYIGLDMGTSGIRGILVDEAGRVIAEADSPLVTAHPHPGWSEQDPDSWITACEAVMAALRSKAGPAFRNLRGLGLSGHMHGATLVDADGKALRPCILWNDTRSEAEAAALDAMPVMRAVSANIVFPGFTAPKLVWVATHEPDVFAKVARVLLPKDYLRLWLTGDYISDMSDSAGTSWLDVGARGWSDPALAATGMHLGQMPDLVEGSAPAGTLRRSLQDRWGFDREVIIAGGAADNAAAACGVGCLNDGLGFVSLGTSGVLLAARNGFAPAPETAVHTFCHAVPDRWYQMGVTLSATDSLNWLARNLDQTPGALAGRLPDRIGGPSPTLFLPYLSGERTPHNDAKTRGAFIGLDIATDQADLTQAVMEGVAFALRDCLEAMQATGLDLQTVLAVGGGSRSPFWVETLATLLDLPLSLPQAGELGAAMGAARLAICAATGAAPETVMTPPEIASVTDPRHDLRDAYEAAYARYRAAYPAIRGLSQ